MPPIPAGYAQINYVFTGTAIPLGAEVTFAVQLDDPADTPATVGAKAIAALNGSTLMAHLSSGVAVTSTLVKFGPDATGPSAVTGANLVGGGTAAASPNVAFLVRKNTSSGGRAGRGRNYWPGVPEAAVSEAGVVPSNIAAAMDGDLAALLASLLASDIPMVLLHEVGAPLVNPSTVTSYVLDNKVATQRRRLR